jgi:hypothetical protein
VLGRLHGKLEVWRAAATLNASPRQFLHKRQKQTNDILLKNIILHIYSNNYSNTIVFYRIPLNSKVVRHKNIYKKIDRDLIKFPSKKIIVKCKKQSEFLNNYEGVSNITSL